MKWKSFITTSNDPALAVVRIVLGTVMLAHGMQKLAGWFGGHGISWTIERWEAWFGLPAVVTMLVILGESFGAMLLIAGFLGRAMAAVTGVIMLGAIYLVHWKSGFFMNWYAQPQGEGFEYHILVLAMVSLIIMKGSGALSFDAWITRKHIASKFGLKRKPLIDRVG